VGCSPLKWREQALTPQVHTTPFLFFYLFNYPLKRFIHGVELGVGWGVETYLDGWRLRGDSCGDHSAITAISTLLPLHDVHALSSPCSLQCSVFFSFFLIHPLTGRSLFSCERWSTGAASFNRRNT
jgi:hypothetical protein